MPVPAIPSDDSHGQAPQLALSPTTLAGGTAGTAYTGTSLGLVDASPSANAEEAYVPQGAAFAVTGGSLPTVRTLLMNAVFAQTRLTRRNAGGAHTLALALLELRILLLQALDELGGVGLIGLPEERHGGR